MADKRGPLALIILDGWGYTQNREGNAVTLAATPYYDELAAKYPQTLLQASSVCVGLPHGVMGNSEVGHMNIGSGRVIRTDIARIDYAISNGDFSANEILVHAMDKVTAPNDGGSSSSGGALHLIGLVSDGRVHSSLEHLYALLRMAKERGLTRVYIHGFTDGRDTMPNSGRSFVEAVQTKCGEIGCGKIASIVGRFYAMDRDKRWERTKRAYDLLVNAEGERTTDPLAVILQSYERNVTDEFIEPVVVTGESGEPVATIKDGDSVIFFNYRSDRARQMTSALAIPDFDGFPVPQRPQIHYTCFTQYDKTLGLPIAFGPLQHVNILADVFARDQIRNYRFAETEKYAHVTYFFNGGTEREFPGESRLLVPSPKVPTYDLEPEMSAFKITDKVLRTIEAGETDVFIINFANPDMVGHTGNLAKTIEAVQHVDTCLGWITKAIRGARGRCLVTADHGNCEQMIDFATGKPHTAHTTNLVPFHLVDDARRGVKLREGGALEDIAPTMLNILGIEQPEEMSGRDLCEP